MSSVRAVNEVKNDLNNQNYVAKDEQPLPSIQSSAQSTEDKKLTRVARNNKVEYIYVNTDGEILPNHHQKIFAAKSKCFLFVIF